MMAVADVHHAMLADLRLATELQGRRQGDQRLDPLFHFRDDSLEQASDLRARPNPGPLTVALLGQMHNLRLQFHDPGIGRIVVGDGLMLATRLLWGGWVAVGPRHVLVNPAGGNVRHDGTTDLVLLGNSRLFHARRKVHLDAFNFLLGQTHGRSNRQGEGAEWCCPGHHST